MTVEGEELEGGWQSSVIRRGDVVHRSGGSWSSSVLAFLRHLEEVGFAGSPRVVGSGFDDKGNETLTFVDGASPHPHAWSADGVWQLGSMLADLHRAAESFSPPPDAVWQDWFGRPLGDISRSFGHGDLGQWNVIARDGMPVGFIDWDTAGPCDPVWEVAQTAWLNAQLFHDELADELELGSARERAQRLAAFIDGYGLGRDDRAGLVDKMVEFAVRAAEHEAVEHRIRPDTTAGVADDGYPFAWGMAWRIRSAAWMLENRSLLERGLCN